MSTKRASDRHALTRRIRRLPALALVVASATCAQTPAASPTPPAQEPAAMNAPAAEAYRPHTLDDFPELTPEEIGRRFLALADSLESFDELTLDRLHAVMRLSLMRLPDAPSPFFTMHLPASGWYYGISYYTSPVDPGNRIATYQFTNRPAGWDHNDDRADMAPVCGLDYQAYVAELEKKGFVEREDLAQYDSPVPPAIYNARGKQIGFAERRFFRFPVYSFSRGDVGIVIHRRREADAPEAKLYHACVERISIGRMY